MRPPPFLLGCLLISLPVFAQDWGRYAVPQTFPTLAETQVMRPPVFVQPPSFVPKVVPNLPPFRFPTPPGVGQNVKK